MMDDLYELCGFLENDLREMNSKITSAGGKLNNDTLSYVDKLAHCLKSVKSVIVMEEASEDGYSENYSRDNYGRGRSYGEQMSYGRGRGKNAKRDSMGRYAERGYSNGGDYRNDMLRKINDMAMNATEPRMRQQLQSLAEEFEQM